jgi:hypothetical protein
VRRKGGRGAELSRTPVSRGETFCSLACGCGCLRKDYERAVRDAGNLLKKLRGSGWKAVVWENIGWHFKAVSGTVQVYGDRLAEDGKLRYTCLISDSVSNPVGGSMLWTDECPERCHGDPNEAVASMFRAAVSATVRLVEAIGSAALATGRGGVSSKLLPAAPSKGIAGLSAAGSGLSDLVKPGRTRRRLPN